MQIPEKKPELLPAVTYPRCFKAIVPVPRKGQKRDEYMKNPDTIGELYLAAQGGNQDAARRLFGFVAHFEAKGWVDTKGNAHPPSDVDVQFRFNLDEFNDWHEAKHSLRIFAHENGLINYWAC